MHEKYDEDMMAIMEEALEKAFREALDVAYKEKFNGDDQPRLEDD